MINKHVKYMIWSKGDKTQWYGPLKPRRVINLERFKVLGSLSCLAGCVSDCPPPIKDMLKQRNNSTFSLVT